MKQSKISLQLQEAANEVSSCLLLFLGAAVGQSERDALTRPQHEADPVRRLVFFFDLHFGNLRQPVRDHLGAHQAPADNRHRALTLIHRTALDTPPSEEQKEPKAQENTPYGV